ncbi:TraR/DksA family transcriptional regulator [Streptomyces sp. NPDC020983]|uniref:TraR/DksA family transcriptional regulator n=1 Tax=Streptomyces sp. NPDC020983 TaxID=3365106 RepID=UPI0037AA24F7
MSDSHRKAAPAVDTSAVRERLAEAREAAAAQIAALGRDIDAIVAANALAAVDDEHDPEGSSTAFERAHTAALLDQARQRLAALDDALERLGDGAYGRCEGCGEPIPPERLAILPAAAFCTRCAEVRGR